MQLSYYKTIFCFQNGLGMFSNKLRRLSRNNIIRLIFTKNIVCRKQGREGQHHKYAVLLFFNLRSGVFFFFGEIAKVGGRGKRIKRTRLFPFVSQTKGKEGLLIAGYVFFRKQFACHVWEEENGPLSRCGRMVQKEQKYIYLAGWQMTQWDLGKKRTAF